MDPSYRIYNHPAKTTPTFFCKTPTTNLYKFQLSPSSPQLQAVLSHHAMPSKQERWEGGWAIGNIWASWRWTRYQKKREGSALRSELHALEKGLANKQK